VRLITELVTDRVDQYGRLLRYIVRVRDGVNVNIRLVAVGAAAPYFYRHRRGRYANRLEFLAKRARAKKLGLWVFVVVRPTTLIRESKRGHRVDVPTNRKMNLRRVECGREQAVGERAGGPA
jgi:endonuclease YncB( thermonuclease family)